MTIEAIIREAMIQMASAIAAAGNAITKEISDLTDAIQQLEEVLLEDKAKAKAKGGKKDG